MEKHNAMHVVGSCRSGQMWVVGIYLLASKFVTVSMHSSQAFDEMKLILLHRLGKIYIFANLVTSK